MLRRILAFVLGLVLIAAFVVGYLYVDTNWGNRLWPEWVGEVEGIQIGAPEADLLFKKGAPTYKEGPVSAPESFYSYVAGERCRQSYQLVDGKVNAIWIQTADRSFCYPRVAGIATGDSMSYLVMKLGEPDYTEDETLETGAIRRTYKYYKLGVWFDLEQERVVNIIVN